jgi:hypothetical protein
MTGDCDGNFFIPPPDGEGSAADMISRETHAPTPTTLLRRRTSPQGGRYEPSQMPGWAKGCYRIVAERRTKTNERHLQSRMTNIQRWK